MSLKWQERTSDTALSVSSNSTSCAGLTDTLHMFHWNFLSNCVLFTLRVSSLRACKFHSVFLEWESLRGTAGHVYRFTTCTSGSELLPSETQSRYVTQKLIGPRIRRRSAAGSGRRERGAAPDAAAGGARAPQRSHPLRRRNRQVTARRAGPDQISVTPVKEQFACFHCF